MKILLLGNAGAGKTRMAQKLVTGSDTAVLSLDEIAWNPGPERKLLDESKTLLDEFIETNQQWVIEGCYADLIEYALPHCEELRFLNPGTETCLAHCKSRAWEPDKFSSKDEQDKALSFLLEWVAEYDTRTDEYGLARHRQVFASFTGNKREYVNPDEY